MDKNVGTHGSCVRQPERKSPRAKFHNYSGGEYFVTICTENRKHYFGEIINNTMLYSEIGAYCHKQFNDLSNHYVYAEIPVFVIMPNHVHAIICIHGNRRTHEPCVPTERTALAVIIGGIKRAVTVFARRNDIEFGWQPRYHDHIIRGIRDGNLIAEYIENNISSWTSDCFYEK